MPLKPIHLPFLLLLFCVSCQEPASEPNIEYADPLPYVNPFIGTGGHGHTYPGATRPFGMMQLSPDTRLSGWDGCSGYHYSDSIIYGFSHTHLSGTGVSDYGDILLMPVNNGQQIKDGALDYEDFQSPFSHESETATAGYYEVYLDKPKVSAALTTTLRGGIHHYQFEQAKEPAIVLDLEHRDDVLACDFQVINNRRIEGFRHSKAWAEDQRLFFVIEFSEPFTEHEVKALNEANPAAKGIFLFPEETSNLMVKVAISAVDPEGAQKNFAAELQANSFDKAKSRTEKVWRNELQKVEAEALDEEQQHIFYSALYHSMLAPNVYSDVDGRYRGMDQQIHQDEDHVHYTVFSLWDTHRTAHPLFTITDQYRTNDFVHTMLQKYKQGGIIPIWDLSACYTGCMIGYHGVSVIADAYLKGIQDYDAKLALEAIIHSARQEHLGLDEYQQNGFIAVQSEAESVSKTLEYAYDDWCIAQMAQAMGDDENHEYFLRRSLNYRNLFDLKSKFFRPRRENFWKAPFDPFEVNSNYTEANAWQYGFAATHDLSGFITLHGGKEQLGLALDSLFNATTTTSGRDQVDITGLIGQYAHGNEPSHHIGYLYNYINKPWKTQQKIREILATQYQNTPDGISGNEDCGQMSAWYIMSAMGFYPVLPGSDYYVIGSPALKSARINLENGEHFEITTANNSSSNIYIQSVTLNGRPYAKSYIDHATIMAGGQLHFEMGSTPNKEWGSQDENIPVSAVNVDGFIQSPYISEGQLSFTDENVIRLDVADKESTIYYQLNDEEYQPYDENMGILMTNSGTLCTYAQKEDQQSPTICTNFVKRDRNLSIELMSTYAAIYDGGTPDALVDGLRGGEDYRTGSWQGFDGQHLEFILDLSTSRTFNTISCGFLQDENSWIFFPSSVEYAVSENGKDFVSVGTVETTISPKEKGVHLEDFSLETEGIDARYVKVKAISLLKCPEWHKGAIYDGDAWLFADEIIVK